MTVCYSKADLLTGPSVSQACLLFVLSACHTAIPLCAALTESEQADAMLDAETDSQAAASLSHTCSMISYPAGTRL